MLYKKMRKFFTYTLTFVILFTTVINSFVVNAESVDQSSKVNVFVEGDGIVTLKTENGKSYQASKDKMLDMDLKKGSNIEIDIRSETSCIEEFSINGETVQKIGNDKKTFKYSYILGSSPISILVKFKDRSDKENNDGNTKELNNQSSTFGLTRATYVKASRRNLGWSSSQMTNMAMLKMGDEVVFCIQPHQLISTADPYEVVYTKPNYISNAELRKISLAVYYGMEYHSGDKWYATTQGLIWHYLGESWSSCIVDFKDGTTNETMMTELNNLVNSHTKKPSFDGSTLSISPGETITVTDINGMLDRFTVTESIDGVSITKTGNTLTITAASTASKGTYNVDVDNNANIGEGTNKYYTTWGTSIHGSDGWQRCGKIYVSSSDAVSSAFNIEVKENKGSLTLTKSSSNSTITSNNNNYSLANAVYGVYTDKSCKTKVAELTTDKNGKANSVELTAGNYYVKEISAPSGYALSSTVHSVVVSAGQTYTLKVSDVPLADPIGILLKKVDEETNSNVLTGSKSLENAEFTVKFYSGNYAENIDPASLGKTPTKQWVLKTDEDGFTYLSESYKVSGDSFYFNGTSNPTIPLGTLTIQETKAPSGYKLNSTVFVRKIKQNGTSGVVTYKEPIVKEAPIKFTIQKVQKDNNVIVPNTTFIHTMPNGKTEEIVTDNTGQYILDGLQVGIHTLKEVKTIEGLKINENEFQFKINTDGSVSAITNITEDMGLIFSKDANKNGVLKVENEVSPYQIKINKFNDKKKLLDDVEFTLYLDEACTNKIETLKTTNGTLTFKNLKVGQTYYLKETKSTKGYRIPVEQNGKVHVYKIRTESTPSKNVFDFYIDGNKYTTSNTSGEIRLEGDQADRIVVMDIINPISKKLPETGSSLTVVYSLLALASLGAAVFFVKRNKKTRGL